MNQEIYDDFLARKAAGHPTPSWVSRKDNPRLTVQENKVELQQAMPGYFNFLDIESLATLFRSADFQVEQACYFRP